MCLLSDFVPQKKGRIIKKSTDFCHLPPGWCLIKYVPYLPIELFLALSPVVCPQIQWYWARTRDKASHSPIPIPLGYRGHPCVLGIDFISGSKIALDFDRKAFAIQNSQVEEEDEGNLRVDVSERKLNVVANASYKNSVENIIGEQVNCAIIRDFELSLREQLIEEQRKDPELGHIYRYLEIPEDSSVKAAICENWSRDFRIIKGLLSYAKYTTKLGQMRVYIPKSLRNEIMREFHDKPSAGHFGRFKTYHKIRDACYFPYMRKFIEQYVYMPHVPG
ncbi:hypothetical protein TNCV_3172161 [Trichonephila clavipes]|nr:hypothetical protein TNCV_3172161 [Trichonephila clavipes]